MKTLFPPLPYNEWVQTLDTLHLYCQIVGKIRLELTPEKNHWWNVPLYVTPYGLTTGTIPHQELSFEIDFDFVKHQVCLCASTGEDQYIDLKDGLSVASLYQQVFDALKKIGVEVNILAEPYETISKIPFAKDEEHKSYDKEYVERFWHILLQVHNLMYDFSSRFYGKATPVHMFWHSFDLAYTRFSGKRGPEMKGGKVSDRNAYSHEVISVGFWPGDPEFPEAAFYSYTYPAPEGLNRTELKPAEALWAEKNGSPMAVLRYQDILQKEDPQAAIMEFFESAYQAGAKLAHWDIQELTYHPFRS